MGIIDLSKLGKISGKIGPVVAYVTKSGQQRFRAYVKPADPRTPGQLAHRAKFGLVNTGLAPLLKAIKRGHPGNENAYRELVGKAYREAITGEYPRFFIDFSKIQIASGPLPLPGNARVSLDSATRVALFTWDTRLEPASRPGSDADTVNIACFDTAHPSGARTLTRDTRAAGKATVELPAGWQPATTHFWLYLSSPDLKYNSNSVYLKQD